MDFRERGGLAGFFRWLTRLLAVVAVTVGVAYYWPLHRAYRALTLEHARVSSDRETVLAALADARGRLTEVARARDALQAKSDAAGDEAARERAHLVLMESSVRAKLARLVDRKVTSVASRGDRLVLSVAESALIGVEMSAAPAVATRLGLCEMAQALLGAQAGATIEVVAFAADGTRSPWDGPALRAARVAEALESVCHVPGDELATVVRGKASAGGPSLELGARVSGISGR